MIEFLPYVPWWLFRYKFRVDDLRRYGTQIPVATKMSILRPACYAKFKDLIGKPFVFDIIAIAPDTNCSTFYTKILYMTGLSAGRKSIRSLYPWMNWKTLSSTSSQRLWDLRKLQSWTRSLTYLPSESIRCKQLE
jgi:hypothetical protein